jgi:Flp pilus assembly protein TadB
MGFAPPRGMKLKHLATLLVLAVALVFPARAQATERTHTRPAATVIAKSKVAKTPSQRSRGSRADENRYAAREKASNDAKKYRAGDVIVISATAAIIILLGVIIILIIT